MTTDNLILLLHGGSLHSSSTRFYENRARSTAIPASSSHYDQDTATTIPFALLTAVILLWGAQQTINIMTLGGLALAIGILVDEATVTIENIHTHLAQGKRTARAVLDASREVIIPLLLAMLSILAVFVPSFFMVGVTRSLFVPLSLAVGFSMVASYLLASSLVPVMAT
jgi:multidrug efflux pump subunit AcrB